MKRFSEMTPEELSKEIQRLEQTLSSSQFSGESEVLKQKLWMAKSYAVKDKPFLPGAYVVADRQERFHLRYVNGIMGWGEWENGEEGAVPLAALIPKEKSGP